MYLTANSEYHLHADTCVAVRDRRTGAWLRDHRALGARLLGGFVPSPAGGLVPDQHPRAGHHLVFLRAGRDLVTSAVLAIDRPPKDAVDHYVTAA
jgi:hypothetical protein